MDKEIVAERDGKLEGLEEIAVRLGQRREKRPSPDLRPRPSPDQLGDIQAIGPERGAGAIGEPVAKI